MQPVLPKATSLQEKRLNASTAKAVLARITTHSR
jgi:hypothetical protein